MAGDLYWNNVGLALHCDDVGLTDIKGNAMTLTGVTRSSTESKFGGYSAYFDGASELKNTTDLVPDISVGAFSAQFWVNPSVQTQADPVVLSIQDVSIEYKPTGFSNGFVLSVSGVRTAFGVHPESDWYYISVVKNAPNVEVWIGGQLAYTYTTAENVGYGAVVHLGMYYSAPATGFVGYIDDVLVTPGIARTDHSVPTAAFPEFVPDPVGVGAGNVLVRGTGVGEVPASGFGTASLFVRATGVGTIPSTARGSGKLRISGAGVGAVGRVLAGAGPVRLMGAGTAAIGKTCSGSGFVSVRATGSMKQGRYCIGSGRVRVTGSAVGSSTAYPVAVGRGAVRVFANGEAGLPLEDFCP